MAMPHRLPHELSKPESLDCMTGAFMRFFVQHDNFNSPVIRNGTHQGVLVEGPHRAMFKAIETAFASQAEPALFGGHHFSAPLCTSANRSGDPLGSITDWERAYAFAKERKIGLVVRCEPAKNAKGSYPIFSFHANKVTIERQGPKEEEIKRRLPARLFVAPKPVVAPSKNAATEQYRKAA